MPDVFIAPLIANDKYPHGFSFASALIHTVTDAHGDYRIDGVRPGEFLVVALPHNAIYAADRKVNRAGFAKTFYPTASRFEDASRVLVGTTAPVRADIKLLPARLSIVTGTVIGENGQPVPDARLALAHGDGFFGLDSRALMADTNGRFVIPPMPPGEYFLEFHESAWPPPRGEIPLVSSARVVIESADVPNVRVAPIHMVSASGRVVVDAVTRASMTPSSITVGVSPADFDGNPGPSRPGVLQDDLSFNFKAWPMPSIIRVLPENIWTIKAVRLNGVDVTGKPIDFVEGRPVTGLEVELIRRR